MYKLVTYTHTRQIRTIDIDYEQVIIHFYSFQADQL